MTRASTLRRALSCGLAAAALAGCTDMAPKPWQKGNLAKPQMAIGGDPLERRYDDHIYTSREAARGGQGVGGGGCGCN